MPDAFNAFDASVPLLQVVLCAAVVELLVPLVTDGGSICLLQPAGPQKGWGREVLFCTAGFLWAALGQS